MCITGPITDPLLLEVRRNHVMKDALGTLRYSQSDLSSKLQIKFIGEAGVDLGGLRREFFSLLAYQFSHSALTSGSPGRLTLRKNFVEREKNTFFYLGQLVALSILQDGPGLPVFADCVVNKILNITNGVNPNDLNPDLVKTLEEMTDASTDRELQDLYFSIYDEREAAGFILPSNIFKKDHIPLLQSALVNNMVLNCRDELDQFIEGLQTHDVLTIVRQEKLTCLFSGGKPPVTVADVRGLMNFKYREDINREADRETGQQFVRFLQATKGDGATINGITLKPKDVLMWMSGSTEIPAVGFHKQIDIEFGGEERVNTCALCVTLKHLTPAVEDPVLYLQSV
ncbi:E3 ISG15--protein ligase HERC5-like [Dreissena polymorpha]|nr:E3 ISG15--protein ligase HERC5-like [Dreissena polymorpha]